MAVKTYWELKGSARQVAQDRLLRGEPWWEILWELSKLGSISCEVDLDEGATVHVSFSLFEVPERIEIFLSGLVPYAVVTVMEDDGSRYVLHSLSDSRARETFRSANNVIANRYRILSYRECALETSVPGGCNPNANHNIWELVFNDHIDFDFKPF